MMPFETSFMPLLEKIGTFCGKNDGTPFSKSFVTNGSLHDPRGPGLGCQCDGY